MLHPDDADACLRALERIEAAGLGATWHDWHRRDQAEAVHALRHRDPVAETRRLGKDWGGLSLRAYYTEVYAAWRESTTRGWAQEARHWPRILEGLGDVRVRDVDPWIVADYLDGLTVQRGSRAGLPASGNTKRIQRAILKALLKRAYRLRHVSEVPDLGVFHIKGATEPVRPPVVPLTADEARRLLQCASCTRDRALFGVAIGQGLRPSELVRMQWQDIDWHTPSMQVRGSKTEAANARIPITPIALPHLRALWMELGQPETGPVFVAASGAPYASSTGYRKALETALRRAGIGRRITPYQLRHSFATIAWAAGIPKDVARRILRHTDSRMLDAVYERPSAAQLAARVSGLTL